VVISVPNGQVLLLEILARLVAIPNPLSNSRLFTQSYAISEKSDPTNFAGNFRAKLERLPATIAEPVAHIEKLHQRVEELDARLAN